MGDKLLTKAEVMERLGITEERYEELLAKGRLTPAEEEGQEGFHVEKVEKLALTLGETAVEEEKEEGTAEEELIQEEGSKRGFLRGCKAFLRKVAGIFRGLGS